MDQTGKPQRQSVAMRAANLFKSAVGLTTEEKPAVQKEEKPVSEALVVEKLSPVASANKLAERCRLYLSTADVNKIREAFRYADEAHLGQFRNSGAPYITHPIAVAEILASWLWTHRPLKRALCMTFLKIPASQKSR